MTKRTRWVALSVVLGIFVIVGVIYLTADKQTTFIGKVLGLSGLVEVQKSTAANVVKVFENMSFTEGDTIFTREDGQVNVQLDASKLVYVSPNTEVVFTELVNSIDGKGDKNYLKLYEGKVLIDIDEKLQGDSKFEVETPNAIMGVMGTEFIISYENGGTWVVVTEGEVQVERDGEVLTFVPNNKRVFISDDPEQPVEVLDVDPEQLQSFTHDFLPQEEHPLSTVDLPVLQAQYEERQQLAEMEEASELSALEEGQANDEDAMLAEGTTLPTPPDDTPPSTLSPIVTPPLDGAPTAMIPVVAQETANDNLPTTIVDELLQRPTAPVVNSPVGGVVTPPQENTPVNVAPPVAENRPTTAPVAAEPAPSRPQTNPPQIAPTLPSGNVPPVAENKPSVPEQISPPQIAPTLPSGTVPPVAENKPSVPEQISPPQIVPTLPSGTVPPVADNKPSVPEQISPPQIAPTLPSGTVPPVAENKPSVPEQISPPQIAPTLPSGTVPPVADNKPSVPPTENNTSPNAPAEPSPQPNVPSEPVETAPPVEETNPANPPVEVPPKEDEGHTPPDEPSSPPSETIPDEDGEQPSPPTEGETVPSPSEPTDPTPTNPPAEQLPPTEPLPGAVDDGIVAMKERLQALVLSTTDLVEAVQTEEIAVIDEALQAAIEALTSTEPMMETLEQRYNDLLEATQHYMEQKNEETASARAYLNQLMNGVREAGIQQYDDPLLQEALRQGDAVLLNNEATRQEIVQATNYIEQAHAQYTREVARLVAKQQFVEAYNQATAHDKDAFIGQLIAASIAAAKPLLVAEQTLEQYDAMRQQLQTQLQRAIELYEQDMRPLYEQMNTYYYQIEQLANRKEIEPSTRDWWYVERAQHAQAVTVEQMKAQLAAYEQILARMLFEMDAYEQQLQVELDALKQAHRQMEIWLQLQIPTVHNTVFTLFSTAESVLLVTNHTLEYVQQLNEDIQQTFADVPALIAAYEQQMNEALHTLQTLVATARAHSAQIVLAPYIDSAEQTLQQQATLQRLQVEVQSLQSGLQRADELLAQEAEHHANAIEAMRATVRQLLATFTEWQEQQGHLWSYPLLANYKEIGEQTELADATLAQLAELESYVQTAIDEAELFNAQYKQDVEDAKQQLAQRMKAAQSLEIHQLFILQPVLDAAEQLLATDATLAEFAQAIKDLTEAIEAASKQPAPQPVSVLQPLADKLTTLVEQDATLADRLSAHALLQEAREQLTTPMYTDAQLTDLVERLDDMISDVEIALIQYVQNEPLLAQLMQMMNVVDQHATLDIQALVEPIDDVRAQIQQLLENPYVPSELLQQNVQAVQTDVAAMDGALQQFSEQKQQLEQLLNEVAQWLVDNEAYASLLQDDYETHVQDRTIYATEGDVLFYTDYFDEALQRAQHIVTWTEQLSPYTASPYSELQVLATNVLEQLTTDAGLDETALLEQMEQIEHYVATYETLLAQIEQTLPSAYTGSEADVQALYLQGKEILAGAYPTMDALEQFVTVLAEADFTVPTEAQPPSNAVLQQKVAEKWRYLQHLRTLATEEEIAAKADAWQQVPPSVENMATLTEQALYEQLESMHALITYYEGRILLAEALQQFEYQVEDFANHTAYMAAKATYVDMTKEAADYEAAATLLQSLLSPVYSAKEALQQTLQRIEKETWHDEEYALLADVLAAAHAIYQDATAQDADYNEASATLDELYSRLIIRRWLVELLDETAELVGDAPYYTQLIDVRTEAAVIYANQEATYSELVDVARALSDHYDYMRMYIWLGDMIEAMEQRSWSEEERVQLADVLVQAKAAYAQPLLSYEQLSAVLEDITPTYAYISARYMLRRVIADVEMNHLNEKEAQQLAEVLMHAKIVYANEAATAEELRDAAHALNEPWHLLRHYRWLGEHILYAETTTWQAQERVQLADVLAEAKRVYANEQATLEDIIQASEALETQLRLLTTRPWLGTLIEDVKATTWREEEQERLVSILAYAEAAYTNEDATYDEQRAAGDALQQMVDWLQSYRYLGDAIQAVKEADWTEEQYAIIAPIVAEAQAVYQNEMATSEELTHMTHKLNQQHSTMRKREWLGQLITQMHDSSWTEVGQAPFTEALQHAEMVYANEAATSEELAEATNTLYEHYVLNLNRQWLGQLITRVHDSSWDKAPFTEVLQRAEMVYANEAATSEELEEAASTLETYYLSIVNRQWLGQLITQMHDSSWTEVGQAEFTEALQHAEMVYANEAATSEELAEAANTLYGYYVLNLNRQWLGELMEQIRDYMWDEQQWAQLQPVLVQAERVYTQDWLDAALLLDTINALTETRNIIWGRADLYAIIQHVKEADWTEQAQLAAALAKAETVYADEEATSYALYEATYTLQEQQQRAVQRKSLYERILQAEQRLIDGANEALQAALVYAKEVYADEEATSDQLQKAEMRLEWILTAKSSREQLALMIEEVQAELTAEEQVLLAQALAAAQAVYTDAEASEQALLEATNTLSDLKDVVLLRRWLAEDIAFVSEKNWSIREQALLADVLSAAQTTDNDLTADHTQLMEAWMALHARQTALENLRWLGEMIADTQQEDWTERERAFISAALAWAEELYEEASLNEEDVYEAGIRLIEAQQMLENRSELAYLIDELQNSEWGDQYEAVRAVVAQAEAIYADSLSDTETLDEMTRQLRDLLYGEDQMNRQWLANILANIQMMDWTAEEQAILAEAIAQAEKVNANLFATANERYEASELLLEKQTIIFSRRTLGEWLIEVEQMAWSEEEKLIVAATLAHVKEVYANVQATPQQYEEAIGALQNQQAVVENHQWLGRIITQVESVAWSEEEAQMLAEALTKAKEVYANLQASDAEQNEVGYALQEVRSLVMNRQWLGDIIADIESVAWSEEEAQMLAEALTKAKEVYANLQADYTEQNEVGYALQEVRSLVMNRQWLGDIIADIESVTWSEEEAQMLAEALTKAKEVYANLQASYAEQDEVGYALKAVQAFVENHHQLGRIIADIESVTWSEEEMLMLEEALVQAKAVYLNITVTSSEQRAAEKALDRQTTAIHYRQNLGRLLTEVTEKTWTEEEQEMLLQALAEARAAYEDLTHTFGEYRAAESALDRQTTAIHYRQNLGRFLTEVTEKTWTEEEQEMLLQALTEARAVYEDLTHTSGEYRAAENALDRQTTAIHYRQNLGRLLTEVTEKTWTEEEQAMLLQALTEARAVYEDLTHTLGEYKAAEKALDRVLSTLL